LNKVAITFSFFQTLNHYKEKTMSLKTLLATGLLLTVVSTRTLLSAPILPLTSDFDSGTQGWTLDAQTGWISSGGNPGGYLQTFIMAIPPMLLPLG
jgi:hypothetical protein